MTSDKQQEIPMLDLTREIDELWPEITEAVHRVLRSGKFILGPEVEAFEHEAAEYLGVKHAIGLNSGTDALVIGLRALGIGPGDEVITTSFSFFATAEAIVLVGATPVFVDIREDSFNIDPDLIESAITERTKAILPVHLFGNPAAMTRVLALAQEYDLKVLEDCAQSFGAVYLGDSEGDPATPNAKLVGRKTGAIGDASAFSFYPTKNLGGYGDGGMLVTNDDEVARLARILRNHGAAPERRYANEMVGYNSRLDEIQAAILRVKLPYLDGWNEIRRSIAAAYRSELEAMEGVIPPGGSLGHIYHQFTIRISPKVRKEVMDDFARQHLGISIFYPTPLHKFVGRKRIRLKVSESVASEVASLPVWPKLTLAQQKQLCGALRRSLSRASA